MCWHIRPHSRERLASPFPLAPPFSRIPVDLDVGTEEQLKFFRGYCESEYIPEALLRECLDSVESNSTRPPPHSMCSILTDFMVFVCGPILNRIHFASLNGTHHGDCLYESRESIEVLKVAGKISSYFSYFKQMMKCPI